MSKKQFWIYRATVVFSGAVGGVSEEDVMKKIIAESERLPETVSFKESEIKLRKCQKKPEKGLYHDNKYDW
mgnify:FL=1